MNKTRSRGFTVLELMIVIVVIGILSSVAITRFADVMKKSKEGATIANLGALRSSLSIYYSNILGQYPQTLEFLTIDSAYIAQIPAIEVPGLHSKTDSVNNATGTSGIDDSGGWAFNNASTDPNYGKLWVNCTHTDSKGSLWTSY